MTTLSDEFTIAMRLTNEISVYLDLYLDLTFIDTFSDMEEHIKRLKESWITKKVEPDELFKRVEKAWMSIINDPRYLAIEREIGMFPSLNKARIEYSSILDRYNTFVQMRDRIERLQIAKINEDWADAFRILADLSLHYVKESNSDDRWRIAFRKLYLGMVEVLGDTPTDDWMVKSNVR